MNSGVRFRRWSLAVALALAIAISAVAFWPDGWIINRLVVCLYFTAGFDRLSSLLPLDAPSRLDFATLLNLLMLAPLTGLTVIAFPKLRWWAAALAGVFTATAVEFIQWIALSGRQASFGDVIANSAGSFVGALAGRSVSQRLTLRSTRQAGGAPAASPEAPPLTPAHSTDERHS